MMRFEKIVGLDRKVLTLLFFIMFPVCADCITVYCLQIAYGYSALVFSIVKIFVYCALFLAVKNMRVCAFFYIALFYFPSLVNVLHMMILRAEINAYSIYLAFISPRDEIREFVASFLNWRIVLVSMMYVLISTLFVAFVNTYKNICIVLSKKMRFSWALFFSSVYMCIAFGNENYSNSIDKIIRAIYEYNRDKIRTSRILTERKQINYGKILSKVKEDKPQTYIVIFGESVDRKHMSLYGYYRTTTPYFDSIKDKLVIFKNVRSAYASTILALKWSLAFNGDLYNGDIVSFLNAAGFKTFWISNQYVIEKDDGIFSIVARLTNGFYVFKNAAHQRGCRSSTYDECLVPYIEKAVNDEHNKKVIFIHLLGSHQKYKMRYPARFDVFSESKMSARSLDVAYYDNSIRYTDYVLKSIIDILQKRIGEIIGMVYFSDHGEDCYDNPHSIHSHCDCINCQHMYDIPMIAWGNEEYIKLKNLKKCDTNAEYSTKNMIHSLLDFFGLENRFIDHKKSLFYEKVD